MNDNVFIDTNILVYAHDKDTGLKHSKASQIVATFWEQRQRPFISIQVLQELHVNLARKGASIDIAAKIATSYMSWRIIENTSDVFRQALVEQRRWHLSFWDSMIIAAARKANVPYLLSEDLNAGQDYGSIVVLNPFN